MQTGALSGGNYIFVMLKQADIQPYDLVATNQELGRLVNILEKDSVVAVDLEADSMYRFKEQVCLIQMGTSRGIFIIDPLKVPDLDPLKPFFANPSIKKVFHGADYDVRSLYRDFGITINNLFDTELVCRFLGYKETGLEAVIARWFDVHLEKKYQKRDWSQRPLPEEMMAYAALDVVHLEALARELEAELRHKGRLEWVEEECNLLSGVRSPEPGGEPLFMRFRGAGQLPPRNLAVLEELLQLRAAIAEKKDRPVFKVLSNKTLLGLAKSKPLTLDILKAKGGLSPRQLDMYGTRIVQAIQKASRIAENALPRFPRRKGPRLDPQVPERVRVLKVWRDDRSARLDLDPGLTANKQLLTSIAARKPKSLEALTDIDGIKRWQIDTFGKELVDLLQTVK